jgi:hypothetical protein
MKIPNPDLRTLRQFGFLCLFFFGTLAGLQYFHSDNVVASFIFAGLAVGGGLLGAVRPILLKPVFQGWMILVFPIGWVVSHVLLAGLFFGVFMPLGLILRSMGHDPLKLKKPVGNSYWQARSPQTDASRYLRQY